MVPSVCHIPKVGVKSQTDIIAHLDGAQCLQRINKLISSLTQTSKRTTMVPSVYNVTTSWYWVSHRHRSELRSCPMSATYQQAEIQSHTASWRTWKAPNACNIPKSWDPISHRHHGALRWCPVSATYQQVGIKSHTDIIAHLDSAQCLQYTKKLIPSLTQTS